MAEAGFDQDLAEVIRLRSEYVQNRMRSLAAADQQNGPTGAARRDGRRQAET